MDSEYKGFRLAYGCGGIYAISYKNKNSLYLCNDLVLRSGVDNAHLSKYYFNDIDLARGSIDKYRETHEKPI